jgi:DNA polymerase III subunit gamma/tau
MAYQVLARKYRPQRFADVAGQDHVTRTLINALSQNRIAHGYIFSGHRGIGKTTIARILAMALNCRTEVGTPARPTVEPCGECADCREISAATRMSVSAFEESHSFDVEEIDAATNRGIDEARVLTSKILSRPLRSKYRILILDEAHQITDAAWNSLLKTLEEPPEWAVFMFATTQPEDIPQTIRSRCQHFSFHAVKFDDILAQLKAIAVAEEVDAEEAALALLAEAGDGSMRDALSIMDQAIASAPVENGRPVLSAAQIRELMGTVPNAVFERLLEAVSAGQSAELMEQLNQLLNAGHSAHSLARQLVRYLRNTLMAKLGGEQTALLEVSADERARAARTAQLFSEEELTRNLQIVLRAFDDLNYRQEQRFHLELAMLKLIHAQRLLPIEELLSGVAQGTLQSGGARPSLPAGSRTSVVPTSRASAGPPAAQTSHAPQHSPFASRSLSSATKASATSAPVAQIEVAPAQASAAQAPDSPASHFASPPADASFAPTNASANGHSPSEMVEASESSEAAASTSAAPGEIGIELIRDAVCAALGESGHASAAQLLGAGVWSIDGAMVRIEVAAMGRKMLSLTINTEAEKIIRQQLERQGAPVRYLIIPGAAEGSAAQGAAPVAAKGSIQEAALANPLVQKAREILKAEVRGVVDLREK